MTDKIRYPREQALAIANNLCDLLRPHCERIEIAGSIRRRRPTVGDIEILYVSKNHRVQVELFGEQSVVSEMEFALDRLLTAGVLAKRPSKVGVFTWGPANKLAIHVASTIPVDFFATDADRWWNALAIRTGGKDTNLRLTTTARARGWSLEAYGSGFRRLGHPEEYYHTQSERDVWDFLRLPYPEPWQRT